MTKPPTQGVALEGIAPKPVNTPDKPVNWRRLAALPPFQMYVDEKLVGTDAGSEPDSERKAAAYIQTMQAMGRTEWLLDDYAAWHSDKGLWPKNTPMGGAR